MPKKKPNHRLQRVEEEESSEGGVKWIFYNMPRSLGPVILDISTPLKKGTWLNATEILIDWLMSQQIRREPETNENENDPI